VLGEEDLDQVWCGTAWRLGVEIWDIKSKWIILARCVVK
jgi:hypothetical protein